MAHQPATIGRYLIVEPIGQGGMGTLFLAWDPKLDRQVAIKVLNRDDDELRERFAREARSAARLRHPHIVTIFDVGEHEGGPFIAMEYLQGATLANLIHERTPLTVGRKIELVEELCDGLAFAHRAGIVHRDIKPANLMVSAEGPLKILDFGIARLVEAAGLTEAGGLIGTLNYMSPEQIAGQQVDSRSDIFAVGVVLYELLSHRQAFPGDLSEGLFRRIVHEAPSPLPSHVPDLDPELVQIVARAIEKEPRNRYQDLLAMQADLRRVRGRLESAAASAPPAVAVPVAPTVILEAGRTPKPRRPKATPARLIAAALIGLLALAVLVLASSRSPDRPPPVRQEASPEAGAKSPPAASQPPATEATRPPLAAAPGPRSAPVLPKPSPTPANPGAPRVRSPQCAQLLERVSLGEELTQREKAFLKRECRN